MTMSRRSLALSASAAALALAGCGGGGSRPAPVPAPPSVAPAPTPSPPPPPAPPPAPPAPTGINYNDAEYQRSNGANANGAIHAYNAGGTGRNVKIGVIDSGINPGLAEFAGKIDPASRDMVASRGVADSEGHGTAVSAVAAAARNGVGMMGVAFDATIISLNTSNPNNCDDKGCKHSDSAIAQSIDVARLNGARVINISLGGEGVGGSVLNAVNRATSAGVVVVMSAGNKSEPNPNSFATISGQQAGNGAFIIAGAHDASRNIASFSNQAGNGAAFYLTALGDRVRSINHEGQAYLYSGTSFSAPVISGAAALLASAFPHLTGAQIVQLLLSTADDAGAPGRDAVFGNGILNIQRAFAPQGRTTFAGSGVPVSTGTNGQTSGAMGDAGGEMTGAIILDGYSRAYAMDLAATLARAPQQRPLAQGMQAGLHSATASAGHTSVSITMARNVSGQPHVGLAQAGMSRDDARQARAIAGHALTRLGADTAAALGFSESGRALQQRLIGAEGRAFLIATDPLARAGFQPDAGHSIGLRHDLGPVGLTVTSERGEVHASELPADIGRAGYSVGAVTADRRIGPLALTLGVSRLSEDATVLGGRFAFGAGGATSLFLDVTAAYDFGRGWAAQGSYRRGWTAMAGAVGLVERGRLGSDAFAFDLSKTGAFAPGDRIALRVMQPLRVRSGGWDLRLPVSYSYEDFSVGYETRRMSLAPSGRELDVEAAYTLGLLDGRGSVTANAFLRRDPGHVAAMPDDAGAALRVRLGF
ncbi:MAG: S8 family peptidase [Allosphingosinicella sp.]|uniref:S8 family peptidase n=1 Tax=Allosphingosinicella sp. TaxID=2823234 RepID=UPI00393DFF90